MRGSCLRVVIVFMHHEIFIEFLLVNHFLSVKTIVFGEQTFHTTNRKVLQHVDCNKSCSFLAMLVACSEMASNEVEGGRI